MKNILLVDDDKIFTFLSTKTLQRMGIAKEVHTAFHGREALDLINNYFSGSLTAPDVILLDLNMPIMDGFGFLEAFQRLRLPNKEKIKIVVVSSSENPADIRRSKELGARNYILKPITEELLRTALSD
jgi:CheY-like chemotaxis protein